MATAKEISDHATTIALHDILRTVIAEVFFDPDPAVFRFRMNVLESSIVDGLARRHFSFTTDNEEASLREQAGLTVTRLFASITHPDNPPR